MELELTDIINWSDVQPELQKVDSEPFSHFANGDDADFSTKQTGNMCTDSPLLVPKKMKKKFRRRPRKHKPGNRKRKSHKLRNRNRLTARRQIIPRSSLGAPFLCNDMLMAKDGFVFDTCSGRIEFKPDIVWGHSENPPVCDQRGRQSPQNPCHSRYVPISPDHEQQSLDLDCNENVPVMNMEDEMCLDLNNNEEIPSPVQDSAHVCPTSPIDLGSPDTDLFGFNLDLKDEQDISLYFDDEKDFQFHLQNFEEDTDRYLRNSLMELSRENLEAEYHSTMRRLRSLQSHESNVELEDESSQELKDFSSPLESTVHFTDQLKQLSQLATSVTNHLEKLQQENNHLREENYQLQIALDM